MPPETLQAIIEAALMVAGQPLTIASLQNLFPEDDRPSQSEVRAILNLIKDRHQHSGIELKEIASGFRLQAKAEFSPWLAKLWEERAPRYSRALMETLAIIAYKQPITRAEIEEIRGVAVSSQIVKTLLDREWIRVLGHKELPGKPVIYGTTKDFLDYFNLKSLTDLPTLMELKNLEVQETQLQVQLALGQSTLNKKENDDEANEEESIAATG